MELLQTLRKILLCEDDSAAQLLLEAYVAQEVAAERDRCAGLLLAPRADVMLAAGEMKADEWRAVHAVLHSMRNRVLDA